jgi:hypothetical protein
MYAHSKYMYQFGYRTVNFAVFIDMFLGQYVHVLVLVRNCTSLSHGLCTGMERLMYNNYWP